MGDSVEPPQAESMRRESSPEMSLRMSDEERGWM